MVMQVQPLNEQEQKAVVGICILAAYADGAQAEVERARIERIMSGFSQERPDLASVYQDVLSGKLSLAELAGQLQASSARALAYEMAVCVCNADGVVQDQEKQFLSALRQALHIDDSSMDQHQQQAAALVEQPWSGSVPPFIKGAPEADLDRMILNAAILNGALEIMPHTLATMAIIPLQMRLVYRIGKTYGYELDRGHIRDFLATLGIGLTSQAFEGFTQKVIAGLTRNLVGRMVGGLLGQAAGSAFGFASTYALGQVARKYYGSGRTLSVDQLKQVFSSMLQEGRSLQGRYAGEISQKARQVNVTELLPLVSQQ